MWQVAIRLVCQIIKPCPPCSGLIGFAVESCCIASWLPQQIYSGASTHPGRPQATQSHRAWRVGGYTVSSNNMQENKVNACSCTRQIKGVLGNRKRRHRRWGRGKRSMASGFWILTSGLCCQSLIQRGSRVWLQKILYVWRLRGRHRAESHSERTVHRKRWRLPRRWLKISEQRGHMSECDRAFSPSACHLSISLGRCGSVTWRLCVMIICLSCARGSDSIAPRNSSDARTPGPFKSSFAV